MTNWLQFLKNRISKTGGTEIGSGKSIVDAIGADGVDALTHDFNETGVMQYAHGKHFTTYILFIIPEAVASISAHNSAIQTDLGKLGRVITITQSDALTYPDFGSYTICVLGTDNGTTAWSTANLADIKTISDLPKVCCDSAPATYLGQGTANADVSSATIVDGVANIEASIVGTGIHSITGFAVGNNNIAAAGTTFASLDMSDADITETVYAIEDGASGTTNVIVGFINRAQPDSSIGIDKDGNEVYATLGFYGAAYSYNSLNSLGQGMLSIICLKLIHNRTIGLNDKGVGALQSRLLGNMVGSFKPTTPMIEYFAGQDSVGTKMPVGVSIYDVIGGYSGDGGAAQDDNIKASLDLAHTDLDAIIVKTDNLPTDPADESLLEAAITTAHTTTESNIRGGSENLETIKSAISAVQNNTRFTAAVPVYMNKPDAGNAVFKHSSNLYDSVGNMEDPANNEILLRIVKNDGAFITANLYKENALTTALDSATDQVNFPTASGWRAMERDAVGKYFFFYKVAFDETEETLAVEFGWDEGGSINFQSRSTEVADVHGDLSAILADIGNASASTLLSLYGILGNPSASIATTILDGIDARANNPTLNALLGVTDATGRSINGNIGDFQAQTNLQTLLAALGIPDTLNKPLYTCLVTDRLDHATFGLSALNTDLDAIIANQAGEETISSTDLPDDTVENTIIEVTTTKRLKLDSVWLDFVNLAQDVMIKVYHKIDGTTYRQYDSFSWSTSEEDGVLLRDITINGDWKLTVTSSVAQGAIKAIPYNVIKTTMEA